MSQSSCVKLEKSYSRLQEEHAKGLKVSRERTQKWEQFRADYEALQARLYTLPDQLTHDIMVPFGRFAFMPGKLYHSNEIMVLLGDNWFAKRSVKQALEVAERRKKYVIKMLEDEKKQFQDWEARIAFTEEIRTSQTEHESVVEIKEDLEPSQEMGKRVWKARQPKDSSVPPPRPAFPKPQGGAPPPHPGSHSARMHAGSSAGVMTEPESPLAGREGPREEVMTDEQLWARLDELEREEEGEGQEAWPDRDEEDGGMVAKPQSRSRLQEGKVQRGMETEVGVAREREGEESELFRITVKHSLHAGQSTDVVPSQALDSTDPMEKPLFTSPGDIFRRGVGLEGEEGGREEEEEKEEERKGVRWKPQLVSYQGPLGEGEGDETEAKVKGERRKLIDKGKGLPTSQRAPLAFTGQVVERTSMDTAARTDSTRKVSQFKAARSRTTQ